MCICDWSSDVCSADLYPPRFARLFARGHGGRELVAVFDDGIVMIGSLPRAHGRAFRVRGPVLPEGIVRRSTAASARQSPCAAIQSAVAQIAAVSARRDRKSVV